MEPLVKVEPLIRVQQVSFSYQKETEQAGKLPDTAVWSLQDINLGIMPGEYVAVIGPNGSGKSTLAQLLNGLLLPTSGQVLVGELDTRDREQVWEIRGQIGMVFQNPDNQLVGTTVEEDVAFGPENYGVERQEIRARVEQALDWVDLVDLRDKQPGRLSGGQKQRVAIAGALALGPKCLVLDEPTSMLDPRGRRRVMECVKRMHREQGLAIVQITHLLEETLEADRILVLDRGRLVAEGTVEQIFAQGALLETLGLELPNHLSPPADDSSESTQRAQDHYCHGKGLRQLVEGPVLIGLDTVTFTYGEDQPWETKALSEVDLSIRKGEFVGLCGATGSGKSTLLRLFNGLQRPTSGRICLFQRAVWEEKTDFRELRRRVGMLFQNPEEQIFEATVFDEVGYGPRNQRWPRERIKESVRKALKSVGLPGEVYAPLSPFALSGGEKRKVALAGVLAMEPEILVLDEPLAGLDGQARRELLALLVTINREHGITTIMVSHDLEAVLRVADRIVVLQEGRKVLDV
ncbi:MAG TPA: energy-coupling factor transporter ATPase, partial [Bacillota bacterium]|nr:energy-coupling factor transporter ATPase [Bacillota bacterium]